MFLKIFKTKDNKKLIKVQLITLAVTAELETCGVTRIRDASRFLFGPGGIKKK